ncbi:hypothetical protein [Streptomyces sp. NPDC047869]|uniref:hypothetical protein n=1 Tax=Streptomyces sp. NPDC047869 TaxID=3154709 RepID=UPI00345499CC
MNTATVRLLLAAAIAPWLTCTAISMAESALLFGDADGIASVLLASPLLLTPALVAAVVVAVVIVFRRKGILTRDQWPLGAFLICLTALLASIAVPVVFSTGGGGAGMAVWSVYTGYPLFVFAFTAITWRRSIQ